MRLILYNRVIDTDVGDILDVLYQECDGNYLKHRVRKADYISISCPFHNEGQEHHPSCSVYNREDNENVAFGTFHCFTCQKKGPLYVLVSKVLGISYTEAKYWLIEHFSNVYTDRQLMLSDFVEEKPKKYYLDKSILDKYSYLHPYQFKRGLSEEVIKKFHIGWNPDTDSITFPVWDEHNNLLGITERSTKYKRFYIPEDLDKPVYLLNYIKQNNITDVVVCESQINTLTCWTWGIPAIGLFGTGSNKQYKILQKSGIINYHLAFDGDLAGEHGAKRFIQHMPQSVFIDIIKIPQGKDVNDLTKEEFLSLPRIDKSEL